MMAEGAVQVDGFERRVGRCPGCGREVRWHAMRLPGLGTILDAPPLCEACAEPDAPPARPFPLEDLSLAGVDVEEWGEMSLEGWDPSHDPHLERARRFVGELGRGVRGKSLYLHGTNGNGKTSLAVAVVRELIETHDVPGARIRFVRARQFLRELGDAYRTGTADQVVRRARRVALLVLDEIGKEPPTEHSAGLLAEVIEGRRGSTVLTSNHSLDELAMRYSHVDGMEHLISRLGPREFDHLEFTGPDRRFEG